MTLTTRIKALAAVLLLLMPLSAWAEPVGTFTRVQGQVDILRARSTQAVPVRVGDPVGMRDAVRTKQNSKAEIRFRDESVIQLAPETRISIDEYSFRGNARESGLIGLFRGKVRAVVSKLRASLIPVSFGGANFNIRTPTAIAGVKGTDLIVFYERGVTGVVFLSGHGFVLNPARPSHIVPVRGGQATFVTSGSQPPQRPTAVSSGYSDALLRNTTSSGNGGGNGEGAGGGASGGTNGGTGNGGSTFSGNTTYEGLTAPATGTPDQPQQNTAQIVSAGLGGAITQPPPPPPITETNTQLLVTPVRVNVHIP